MEGLDCSSPTLISPSNLLWKDCLPGSLSPVPKRLGTTVTEDTGAKADSILVQGFTATEWQSQELNPRQSSLRVSIPNHDTLREFTVYLDCNGKPFLSLELRNVISPSLLSPPECLQLERIQTIFQMYVHCLPHEGSPG